MDIYTDGHGLVYCAEHRREVCHTCCADHRLTNMAHKHPSADWMELNDKMDALQEVEHRAMLAQWRAEGHTEPLVLGGPHSQRLWDAVAAPPPGGQRTCALPECGVAGDRLQNCSRCRAAYYCCKDHQVRHYVDHKQFCKRRASVTQAAAAVEAAAGAAAAAEGEGAAGSAAGSTASGSAASGSGGAGPSKQDLVSWKQLEQLGGRPAQGKVLELRVVSPPSFIRHMFEGKDHRGDIRRVACYADEPPRGLALGRVLRWRNPRYHWFMDGLSGARIEDKDLPHISVTANRARASRATASSPPALTIADLPQDVLVRILGLLPDLKERQRVALVSKRFAAAACSPQLLRGAMLYTCVGLQKLRSLAAWLARHGQHVRSLNLRGYAADGDDEDSVAVALATCVATVGAAGQLEELRVISDTPHTEWLTAARSVQHLELCGSPLHIAPAIRQLTALQSLKLSGVAQLGPGVSLPTSITRLRLAGDDGQDMPQQVAQLPRLQRLRLHECDYLPDSLSRLSALSGSLTRLETFEATLPSQDGLAALTRLQHVDCQLLTEAACNTMAAALPHLTGLTCLMLWGTCRLDPLMPALGGLSRLQLCELEGTESDGAGGQAAALPGGPWLRSLRWLGASLGTLLRSVPALQAATGLDSISIKYRPEIDWQSPAATALVDWLASHPPLRRLLLESWAGDAATPAFLRHVVRICQSRPNLLVQCPGTFFGITTLDREVHFADPF